MKRMGWFIDRKHSSRGTYFPVVASWLAVCSAMLLPLVGCGGGGTIRSRFPRQSPLTPSALKGSVHGGQQPVQGAEVELYVAGAAKYGAGAKTLTPAATTDANGDFVLTGGYTCPSSKSLTYLVATGGDPGVGSDNHALAMMAVLGECGNLGSIQSITIDEVTTVGAAFALTPFLGSGGEMGTSAGNAQGLLNAAATLNNLVDLSRGTAPGPDAPANAAVPAAKINTLANILAACVNSAGGAVCNTLFAAAKPASGSAPDNTLDAAVDIARNPSNHVANLFAIPAPTAPFQPSLASAPADWTIAVTYTGSGLASPSSIAVDAEGNVWAANYPSSLVASTVSELSNTGEPMSPSGGFVGGALDESYGIAVSKNGSVWITDQVSSGINGGHGTLTVMNASGDVTSGADGYFVGGVFFPVAIAADTDGSVWTANYGNSTASHLSSAGAALSGAGGYGAPQLQGPVAIAIDASHTAWLANQSADSGSVTSISADGNTVAT